jgi:hypothetical protein
MNTLVWLPNAAFVVLMVIVVFMTQSLEFNLPRSLAEGLAESNKVIIVGGVSLAAAFIVEAFAITDKLDKSDLRHILLAVAVLLLSCAFGVYLFGLALTQDDRLRARTDGAAVVQFSCGLFLFVLVALIVYWFKTIEDALQAKLYPLLSP